MQNEETKKAEAKKEDQRQPVQYLDFDLKEPVKEVKRASNDFAFFHSADTQPSKKALINKKNQIKKEVKKEEATRSKEEAEGVSQPKPESFDKKKLAEDIGFEGELFAQAHPHLPENTYFALIDPELEKTIPADVLKKFKSVIEKGKVFIAENNEEGSKCVGVYADKEGNKYLCHKLKPLGDKGNHRLYGAEVEKNIAGKSYKFIVYNVYDANAHQPKHFAKAIAKVFSQKTEILSRINDMMI